MAQPVLVIDLGAQATAAALVVGERASLIREPSTGAGVWPSGPAIEPLLGLLRHEAARLCPDPVDRLTLTVPTEYAALDQRRDLLIEAAEAAGFRDVELLSEAQAAIVDVQSAGPFPDGSLVLLCDLGDSWKTTLVRVAGADVAPIGHEASSAGRDLDGRLLDDLCTQTGPWLLARLQAHGDVGQRTREHAMDFVRHLKHGLAGAEQVSDRIEEGAEPYRLTRERLDRLAEPGLRWVVASCRSLFARAAAGVGHPALTGYGPAAPGSGGLGPAGGVSPGSTLANVVSVVLVGGAANLASAESIIRGGLGRPVLTPAEPELAILRGAVRWVGTASARQVAADHPRWRVEPLTWHIPGGRARLVRWSVVEGQPYAKGAALAQVRTPDERVFDLTAPEEGVLLAQRARVGDLVGPTLTASSKRPASCLAGDPPGKRQELSGAGEWLLTPDRRLLVECAPSASYVKLWSIPDAELVGGFQPDFEGARPHRGRVFVNPGGRLSLVAWDPAGAFSVFDVQSGRRVAAFRDANAPLNVKVNEGEWRLTAEGEDSGSGGRYRRAVATIWDLATGRRLEKLTDDWQRRLAGYRDRSAVDGFGDRAVSPDGRLNAVQVRTQAGSTAIALQESSSDHEVFRAEHPPSLRVRMAFSADGRFLLANWESDRRSQVDVWEL